MNQVQATSGIHSEPYFPPVLGTGVNYGHVRYNIFPPNNQLKFECYNPSVGSWFSRTSDLFTTWTPETKGISGNSAADWGTLETAYGSYGRSNMYVKKTWNLLRSFF